MDFEVVRVQWHCDILITKDKRLFNEDNISRFISVVMAIKNDRIFKKMKKKNLILKFIYLFIYEKKLILKYSILKIYTIEQRQQ